MLQKLYNIPPRRKYLYKWHIKEYLDTFSLKNVYADKYYQQGIGSYEISYDEEELKFIKQIIKQRIYVAEKLTKITQGKFLDVGCGEGFALKCFSDLGWQVKGVDFSKVQANRYFHYLIFS